MATAQSLVVWPAADPVVTEEAGTRGGTHYGIDLAAKLGDPVLAPFDGTAVFVGGDGASGRIWLGSSWLYPNGEGKTVDLQRPDGLISRVGHLNGYNVAQGQAVKQGDVIGYAGTTGYSTGVHIHWETRWDRAWSGGRWINPRTLNPQVFGGDDMSAKAEQQIEALYAGFFGPANVGAPRTTWARPFGEKPGEAFYGSFDVDLRTQQLVIGLQGQIAALVEAIRQIGGGQIDMAALEAAAEKGAREALEGLTLKAEVTG